MADDIFAAELARIRSILDGIDDDDSPALVSLVDELIALINGTDSYSSQDMLRVWEIGFHIGGLTATFDLRPLIDAGVNRLYDGPKKMRDAKAANAAAARADKKAKADAALEKAGGDTKLAIKQLRIDRSTFNRWYRGA